MEGGFVRLCKINDEESVFRKSLCWEFWVGGRMRIFCVVFVVVFWLVGVVRVFFRVFGICVFYID